MALGFFPRKIYCPNCRFTGKAKLKRKKIKNEMVFFLFALFFSSFFVSMLVPVTLVFIVFFVVMSFEQVCPSCRWKYPMSLSRHQREQRLLK
ncbi:MAG: hypothetical protein ACMUIL_12460 [bacterium]